MKAVLCGTGWRAMFYVRISRMLPELLSLVAIYTRTRERAELFSEDPFPVMTDLSEALSVPHDAVIVATGKDVFFPLMKKLKDRGEFVVSETTFLSLDDSEMEELYDMKGACAEQYMYTPLYASILKGCELVGNIDQLYLSGLHNHHAASIARIVLGLGDSMPEKISSLDFPSRVVKTGERKGMVADGVDEEYSRKLRVLSFGDKLFINDFSSNQYHSYLYGKRVEIRGNKGVVTEQGISFCTSDGLAHSMPFVFYRDSSLGNGSLTLSHVTLGERTVFRNPFYPAMMNDDEIAIAMLLKRIEDGMDYPSINSGIMDARLGRLL